MHRIAASMRLSTLFALILSTQAWIPPTLPVKRDFCRHSSAPEQETSPLSNTMVVDRSTLTLLEHINLNVPDHSRVLPFYFRLLGLGMDPRKAGNLLPSAKKATLWANAGASQFHLPKGEAQRIPGLIGLRFKSLDGLRERLKDGELVDACGMQACEQGPDFVRLTDHYGNRFLCRAGNQPTADTTWQQPYIRPTETKEWNSIAEEYGRDETDCIGIDFVEFACPLGTADQIALFYDSVLDATTSVLETTSGKTAMIAFGNVDGDGRASQSLLFRETSEEIPIYDGHHVAMYVGESAADFEQAFKNAQLAGVVWVNPRFSDKAEDLEGARHWKQFRFKDIVDIETGKKVFELEHEMRSIEHEAWPGQSS